MYVVIRPPERRYYLPLPVIVVTKTLELANKAKASKKYYVIRHPTRVDIYRKGDRIDYYELYGLKLYPYVYVKDKIIGLTKADIGKIMDIETFKKHYPISKFLNAYGDELTLNQITPEYIDKMIEKTKRDIEILNEYKKLPRLYYYGGAEWKKSLVKYALKHGQKIGDTVYWWRSNDNSIIVMDIQEHVGITIPPNCDLDKFGNVIEQQSKRFTGYGLKIVRRMVSAMLKVPELQDYASVLVVLGVV